MNRRCRHANPDLHAKELPTAPRRLGPRAPHLDHLMSQEKLQLQLSLIYLRLLENFQLLDLLVTSLQPLPLLRAGRP